MVVADFGIAHFEEEALLTAVETSNAERLANFVYSAPEQKVRGVAVSSKADIFALGLMLNEMFTQRVPLGARFETIASRAPMFSYLDGLVDQMMMQDPLQRPSVAQVKEQLIARRHEYISLQKIDELSKAVVRADKITDPLITDPIRAVQFDYDNGELIVTLSRAANPLWIQVFVNQATTSFLGMGPNTARVNRDQVRVPVRKDIVLRQKEYVEGWIRNANGLYEEAIKRQIAAQEQQKAKELRDQLRREQERLDIQRILNPR